MTGIEKLFDYKNQLVLLGVTGYTSAGSKSLANILRSETNPFGLPKASHIYSDDYLSNRKLAIAEQFHQKEKWQGFRVIKVSHIILVISLLMDGESLDHAIQCVVDCNKLSKKRLIPLETALSARNNVTRRLRNL